MTPYYLEPDLDGQHLHIGIVLGRFNEDIGQLELQSCLNALAELGVKESSVLLTTVPGALEMGVVLQQMAASDEFDALIALGAVIRGDTYHFEVVSNESASAISRVSLDYGIPIANGVLTCDTDEQAQVRADLKGRECAECAVEMANLLQSLEPEEALTDEDVAEPFENIER